MDYITTMLSKMSKAHEITRKQLEKSVKLQESRHDPKGSIHKHHQGDPVWVLNETRKEGVSPKLQMAYKGPGLVVKKYNDLDFLIQLEAKGRQTVLHYNKLKAYEGDDLPVWIKTLKKKLSKQ